VQDYSAPPRLQAESRYDAIPTSKTYYVEVTIPSFEPSTDDFTFAHNVSARHATPSLSESRVSLYFVPVDDKTLKYVQSFPDLLEDVNFDPGKVKMYPVLKFNGTQWITGEAMPLGYFMPLKVRVFLGGQLACLECTGEFHPQVGTWNSLVLNTGDSFGDTILENRATQFKESVLALGRWNVDADNLLGALFDLHGRLFFGLLNMQSLRMQSSFDIRSVHTVDAMLAGYKYDWVQTDTGLHLRWAGSIMDWQIMGWRGGGVSSTGNSASEMVYRLMWGSIGSYLEGKVLNLLYQAEPVSTGTLLEAANEQGTPIFIIEEQIPERLRFLPRLNPLAYVVHAYRERLLSSRLPSHFLSNPCAATAVIITL
jgi:hypothetical protein